MSARGGGHADHGDRAHGNRLLHLRRKIQSLNYFRRFRRGVSTARDTSLGWKKVDQP
jgi:hypothetical protein